MTVTPIDQPEQGETLGASLAAGSMTPAPVSLPERRSKQMTRKDYVRLAAGLRTARLEAADAAEVRGVERSIVRLADMLAGDNGRFDRLRFYEAAGLGQPR